jgi:hypothetical protein
MLTNSYHWAYLAQFFLEWEMFQTKVVEKIKPHISYSVIFFRKSCSLWDNLEKIPVHAAIRYTFLVISRSVLLRVRNVSDKICRENQCTHLIFSNLFSKLCLYEIMWKKFLYMKQNDIYLWSYFAQLFLGWEMFQTSVVERIKTHILKSVKFFRKSCRLWDNV